MAGPITDIVTESLTVKQKKKSPKPRWELLNAGPQWKKTGKKSFHTIAMNGFY